MRKVTEGVVDVIVYPSASDKSRNRGFAFVEYETHRSAAMARRKLMNGRVDLWGHNIAVDWAEPELEVDEEIMAQVSKTVDTCKALTKCPLCSYFSTMYFYFVVIFC